VFIIEEPYVSDFLASAVARLGLPVLDTPIARRRLDLPPGTLQPDERFARLASQPGARVYANSENAIGWIARHLSGSELPRRVSLFKDKIAFRDLLADLYPDYRYVAVDSHKLDEFDPTCFRGPFVVKPAVGFFSLCVHVVESPAAWPAVAALIEREIAALEAMYPDEVLALDRFVAEEVIEGDEFAVDAYYDGDGEAAIVNIYAHLFGSPTDVSDRVYLTDVETVDRYAPPARAFLEEIGRRARLADFPVHVELRIDARGRVAPIEVNPMRFGAWCVTDLAHFAYGVDPYRCFLLGESPDWDRIAEDTAGRTTAFVVSDLPATVDLSAIESVDYEGFAARFTDVLELRPTDYHRYPVFAFTFVQVPTADQSELLGVLGADLRCHLRMRPD
jgi:hypothetical protein